MMMMLMIWMSEAIWSWLSRCIYAFMPAILPALCEQVPIVASKRAGVEDSFRWLQSAISRCMRGRERKKRFNSQRHQPHWFSPPHYSAITFIPSASPHCLSSSLPLTISFPHKQYSHYLPPMPLTLTLPLSSLLDFSLTISQSYREQKFHHLHWQKWYYWWLG